MEIDAGKRDVPWIVESRMSGWSGVAAGVGIGVSGGVEAFVGETAVTSSVLAVTPALAGPLLVALHRGQAGVVGRFGVVAYLVNLIGLGLFGGAAFSLNAVVYFGGVEVEGPSVVMLVVGCLVWLGVGVRAGVLGVRGGVLGVRAGALGGRG